MPQQGPHRHDRAFRRTARTDPQRATIDGFDFLQGLVKNAGSVLPSIGQWVAPTLNPE